jgi:hypothetical protein
MLSDIILSVIMLNVIMLRVIMFSILISTTHSSRNFFELSFSVFSCMLVWLRLQGSESYTNKEFFICVTLRALEP